MHFPTSSTGLRRLVEIALLAVLYYAGARIGLPESVGITNSTPIWPPAGLAAAAMLVWGTRMWPGVWLGAFMANVVVFSHNQAAPPATIGWVSVVIATGNTIEALMARVLAERWLAKSENVLPAMAERMFLGKLGAFACAFVAVTVGLAGALIGPLAVCGSGIGTWHDYSLVAFTWWSGDATSVLIFTPFLLALKAPFPEWRRGRWYWLEAAAAFATLVLVAWSIFGEWFHLGGKRLPLTFATMVPLVWIARRIGLRGTSVAVMVLAGFAIWFTRLKLGPMFRENEHLSYLLLSGYLWVVAVTNFTIACGEEARQHSQRVVHELNEQLEQRVHERTSELRQMNSRLTQEMEERQRLEKEVLDIAEREQRRLGQDLHEGVSQQLAGVTFLSKILSDRLAAESHPQSASASELSGLLQEALDSTRSMARSFYPVEFESGGLRTALQGLADRTRGLFGIDCELRCLGGAPLVHDENSDIQVYRIVQEALTNVVKHSRAHRVVIECSAAQDVETVRIMDNGVGFGTPAMGAGMGLHLMRYRARLIGADLKISRQNGRGTIVSCSMRKSVSPAGDARNGSSRETFTGG